MGMARALLPPRAPLLRRLLLAGAMAASCTCFLLVLQAQASVPPRYDVFAYGSGAASWKDAILVKAFLDPLYPDNRDRALEWKGAGAALRWAWPRRARGTRAGEPPALQYRPSGSPVAASRGGAASWRMGGAEAIGVSLLGTHARKRRRRQAGAPPTGGGGHGGDERRRHDGRANECV